MKGHICIHVSTNYKLSVIIQNIHYIHTHAQNSVCLCLKWLHVGLKEQIQSCFFFFIKPRVRVYLYVAYSDSSFYYNQSFIYYFHVKRKRWKTKSSSNPFWYVTSYSTHILFTSRISEWKLLRFPATTM